jgi:hypothetical protein
MGQSKQLGPGRYEFDPSVQVTRPEDLPEVIEVEVDRVRTRCQCPKCGTECRRSYIRERKLFDIGDLATGQPRELIVRCSQHHCGECDRYFMVDTSDLAEHRMLYTRRVMNLAILAVVEDRLPYREASWRLWRDHRVFVPFATIQNWVEAGGKKKPAAPVGGLPELGHDRFLRIRRHR